MKLTIFVLAALIGVSYGVQPSNYEISRRRIGGFGIREIWEYLIGAGVGYGQYPYPGGSGYYPGGSGHYPGGSGLYPGSSGHYPGGYPGSNYVEGPPGAHPGCPLCDSSVYSYCSHKEAHDACCCDSPSFQPNYQCRKRDCKFIYANSCQEYHLISSCCCIDLQKNAAAPVVAVAPVIV